MFDNIRSQATTNKVSTAITSTAIAGGILYGIIKKKGFGGTFAYALGFGLVGIAVSTVIAQTAKK